MVLSSTVATAVAAVWYYYAPRMDFKDDSTHTWTSAPQATSRVMCRAVCSNDLSCVQYLTEWIPDQSYWACYTASIAFEEDDYVTHTIDTGFVIGLKTAAVT